jgi:hypothetical protein
VTEPAGADEARRASRVATFAAAAALSVTQDVVRSVRPHLGDGADPDLLAEETLALVASLTARAAEAGLGGAPAGAAARAALDELPLLYHDYLLATALVAAGAQGDVPADRSVYERLERKARFYDAHLPAAAGAAGLAAALPLWMGRVSPPRLPTTPDARLQSTGVADILAVHVRLVSAFARRA